MRTLDRGPEKRLRSDSVTGPLVQGPHPTSAALRVPVRGSPSLARSASRLDEPPCTIRDFEMHLVIDRKSTRLNSSHSQISYAVFCLKKKKKEETYLT